MSPTTAPTATAVQTAQAVRLTTSRLRRRLRETHDRRDLTPTQIAVLSRLDRSGPSSASELAAAEGVRPQSMAASIALLHERGLVHRRPDPHDGRRQLVTITAAARDFLAGGRSAGEQWLARALDQRLTEDEQRTVLAATVLLDRVVAERAVR